MNKGRTDQEVLEERVKYFFNMMNLYRDNPTYLELVKKKYDLYNEEYERKYGGRNET